VPHRGANTLERRRVDPGLARDGENASVGVHQVDCRVSVELQHLVVTELVVGDPMLLEVRVLDTPVPDPVGVRRV
jgi:hypothetical protein